MGKIRATSERVMSADTDSLGSHSNSPGASPSASRYRVSSDSQVHLGLVEPDCRRQDFEILIYGFRPKPKSCSKKSRVHLSQSKGENSNLRRDCSREKEGIPEVLPCV